MRAKLSGSGSGSGFYREVVSHPTLQTLGKNRETHVPMGHILRMKDQEERNERNDG